MSWGVSPLSGVDARTGDFPVISRSQWVFPLDRTRLSRYREDSSCEGGAEALSRPVFLSVHTVDLVSS